MNFLPADPPAPNEVLPALLNAAVQAGASDLEVADGVPPMFKLYGEVARLPDEWTMPSLVELPF